MMQLASHVESWLGDVCYHIWSTFPQLGITEFIGMSDTYDGSPMPSPKDFHTRTSFDTLLELRIEVVPSPEGGVLRLL